ncbi:uncharacterized protein LOC105726151 isoform X3 [Aotus nancymaae]|uniref:uncharacterized protein LOC105726151 isoform X3 n=1 Tax=Aotus nancymaae TaxID=37293 RepID=UPI0030FE1159
MAEGEGKGADCFPQTTKSETHGADYAPWTLYHAVLSPAKNGNGSCPSASPAEDVKLLDNLSSSIGDKKSSMARNRWQWHLSRIDQTPGTKKKSEAAAVCRGAGEPVMEEFHGKNSEAREILRQEGEFKLRLNGNILKRFKRFRRNESWRPSIIQLGSGSTFLFLFFCSKTLNISANLGNR